MGAQLLRASLFAAIEEATYGELELPSSGAPFMPLKSGFSQTPARESIESEEILDDIAPTKGQGGLENPTGTHGLNVKHSAVEGTPPEWLILLKSAMGASFTKAGETVLAGGSTAGTSSTPPTLKVADSSIYRVGMAVLIKDLTNGYSVRNIVSIPNGTDLVLNYNLSVAPAAGVATGIPVLVYPVGTGHPSFSAILYAANGAVVTAIAGARTSDFSVTIPAADKVTADVSYGGATFYWNPLKVTASNKFLDIVDSTSTTYEISVEEKVYRKPQDLALALQNALNATASPDTFTVTYNNTGANVGKFTIASSATPFSIEWSTGTHGSGGTDTHIGTLLGFSDAADDTGSASYTSDNVINLTAGYTPTYDNADFIVAKNSQVWIGPHYENVCRSAEEVTFSIAVPQEDVTDICAESGLLEKLILSRTVEMNVTLITPKYESGMYARFADNETVQAMVNIGPKDAASNWVPGKGVNFYMAQATISTFEQPGGDILKTVLTMSGFITATLKDLYVNFY